MSNESMLKGGDDVPILPNQAGGGESMLQGGEQAQILPNQAGGGESMLQGGEQAQILPNQAGGADYSALDNDFTPEEQIQLQKVAGMAYLIQRKDKNLTSQQITERSYQAANEYAKLIIKQRVGTDDVTEEPSDEEKEAAIAAVTAARNDPEFSKYYQGEEAQEEAAHKVAVAAIIRERKKKNIKIVAAKKAATATLMTTPFKDVINGLEGRIVGTEFYHLTDANSSKEIDKYRQIIAAKYKEINDEVGAQKMRINMYTDVDKYKQARLKQWNNVYKNTNQKVAALIPTIREDAQYNEKEILSMYSRFIYCLPHDLDKIVVIPPIRGNIDLFTKVLYRLDKIGALTYKKVGGKDRYKVKAGITIVFMPSFYADISIADNRERDNAIAANLILFSIFIDITSTNLNRIFILSESTAANYAVGVLLSKSLSRSDIFKNSPLTMLEPSYIVYPYTRSGLEDGIVLSASTAAEPALPKISKFGLADLKVSNIYGNALGLSVKPDGSNDAESLDIFAIRASTDEGGAQQKVTYDLSHPPGPCDGLLVSPELSKLEKEDDAFYLKPMYITKPPEKPIMNEYALMVIQLNPKGDYEPLCRSALTSAPDPLAAEDRHVASEKVNEDGRRVQIEIKGRVYSIREGNDIVLGEWKNKKFTEDEAKFLNSTRLRPGVLEKCFGDGWAERLSNFLYTFTTSRCMTDISLLTKRECYNCRQFLEDVNVFFINNQLQLELSNPDFDKYADEVYESVQEPPNEIHVDHAREADAAERQYHKQFFGTISSYDHIATKERRALIIGINKKTGIYKYYVISVPSDLQKESRKKDEEALLKKIHEQLQLKYKDFIFIY
jgi:hypothetical protein